jgi:hypothetical protein
MACFSSFPQAASFLPENRGHSASTTAPTLRKETVGATTFWPYLVLAT